MSREGTAFYPISRQRPELLVQRAPGEHVWTMTVAYKVDAKSMSRAHRGGVVYLDAENIAITAAGCFVCEQTYGAELAMSPCPGEPR